MDTLKIGKELTTLEMKKIMGGYIRPDCNGKSCYVTGVNKRRCKTGGGSWSYCKNIGTTECTPGTCNP